MPASKIQRVTISPNFDRLLVKIKVDAMGPAENVRVAVLTAGHKVAGGKGQRGEDISLPIPSVHPWSPDDPFLYDVRIELLNQKGRKVDQVGNYFGMRSMRLGVVNGVLRPLLNGKFVFQLGPLDQGYWPDEAHTAATDDALRFDLEMTRKLGFNLVRKHAKVEPQRWYYWADKLGLWFGRTCHPSGTPTTALHPCGQSSNRNGRWSSSNTSIPRRFRQW